MQVCSHRHSPWQRDIQRTSIGKLPCVKIASLLKLIATVCIVQRAIKSKFKPTVTQTGLYPFTQRRGTGCILYRRRTGILSCIGHIIIIVHICKGVDIEISCRVNSRVEHESPHYIPVSIDVLGLNGPPSRLLIIGHLVTDAVMCVAIVHKSHDSPLPVFYIIIVKQPKVVGKRRFQARITF